MSKQKSKKAEKTPDRLYSFFRLAAPIGAIIVVVLLILVGISGVRFYNYEKSYVEEQLVDPLLRIEAAFTRVADTLGDGDVENKTSAMLLYNEEASAVVHNNITIVLEQLEQDELNLLLYRKKYDGLSGFLATLQEDMSAYDSSDIILRNAQAIATLAGEYARYYSGEGKQPSSVYIGRNDSLISG